MVRLLNALRTSCSIAPLVKPRDPPNKALHKTHGDWVFRLYRGWCNWSNSLMPSLRHFQTKSLGSFCFILFYIIVLISASLFYFIFCIFSTSIGFNCSALCDVCGSKAHYKITSHPHLYALTFVFYEDSLHFHSILVLLHFLSFFLHSSVHYLLLPNTVCTVIYCLYCASSSHCCYLQHFSVLYWFWYSTAHLCCDTIYYCQHCPHCPLLFCVLLYWYFMSLFCSKKKLNHVVQWENGQQILFCCVFLFKLSTHALIRFEILDLQFRWDLTESFICKLKFSCIDIYLKDKACI